MPPFPRLRPRALLMAAALLIVPVTGQTQDKPPQFSLGVVYLTKRYEVPPPLSLTEPILKDKGIQGARLAQKENALTGSLLGQEYVLIEKVVSRNGDVPEAARELLAAGHRFIVADLEADDLLAVADLPEAADAIIVNTRAEDDRLRNGDCRANVYHLVPDYAMRADGLAQYLSWKRWTRWFLISGKQDKDLQYAAALRRAANRFGAEIVEERTYQFEAGARRVESGHQQVQTQMPMLTQGAPDYDVLVVADVAEAFGDYLLFRTMEPKVVAGTQGLVAAAWHRSYEQFGSMSLHSAFEKLAKRNITEADYLAWLGVKLFAEAALRTGSADLATIRTYLTSDDFVLPGFKGVGMTFRRWNHQLRQPILIAWARALVSVSPQEVFLHEHFTTDTLGYDEPDSSCHLER